MLCFSIIVTAKRERYHKMPEIYSKRTEELEGEFYFDTSEEVSTPDDSINFISSSSESIEDYLDTAIPGDSLEWKNLPESEYPRAETSDMTAHYTTINVPLFYGNDAEKYGISSENIKKSFFAIYLRKYHWGSLDKNRPIKHVILVAGGPGESGQSWTRKLHKLSRQYERSNLILYVADHRGVYKSRDVVELVTTETGKGQPRKSWRRTKRNENISEKDWLKNIHEFERLVGYPLVAMTCSNAARDLALISLVIRKYNTKSNGNNARFFLHAQSYGTQVVARTLNLLPDFYEGVLLEGLATMELVKESAKADFGILSSCAEDRKCSDMFLIEQDSPDLLPCRSPFDLRNLLAEMSHKPHNRVCRDIFLTQMRQLVYSEGISFHDAIHLSFYELLADDFLNPYTGKKGDFFPGMLVLPLIRDMYYCRDPDRFSRQVAKIIEAIAISVRRLDTPYVKAPSKAIAKTKEPTKQQVDPNQISSYFVQTYINIHEAFDMKGMTRSVDKSYCDVPHQPDLINQCPIWKDQVRKLSTLTLLSESSSKSITMKTKDGNHQKNDEKRKLLDKFDGKYKSSSISSTSSSSSSSDDDSSVSTSDSGSFYKSFPIPNAIMKKHKKHKKHKKKNSKRSKHKSKKRDNFNGFKGANWLKQPKSDESVETLETIHTFDIKNKGPKVKHKKSSISFVRKYYYELDDLAYALPNTEKTKIFVTVGTLDVKTPLLEARRLLARMRSPLKVFFELKNVAHSTEPCRGEIIRAFVSDPNNRRDQDAAMAIADECVRQLGSNRKLDWEFKEVKNIPKEDWM